MTTVPHYASPATAAPKRQPRFNVRLLVFVLAISAPFLYIVGSAIWSSVTGGISDRGAYKEVDLKLLGNFNFDDRTGTLENVPAQYRALDGQKVLLRGYMFSPETAGDKGLKFQFVYDVNKCCFSGPPLVQERVFVKASKEVPIYDQYTLADVVGTLHVRLVRSQPGGPVISVYDLDAESATLVGG
jgi:hypothetical protein